jgi:hypothetical protein
MKTSIAFTLIIAVGIFAFTSGYSIGHSNGASNNELSIAGQAQASVATEKAAAGGYGEVTEEKKVQAAPGYGQ